MTLQSSLLCSKSIIKHLETVLQRIQQAGLTIKSPKCKFAQSQVQYLGHTVGQGCRRPSELKIEAVKNFPTPRIKTDIRAFLGLAGYYSHYIPMFSTIAAPLTDALKGKRRKGVVHWTEDCEKAFKSLKQALASKPVLHSPDYNRQFILQTDASGNGIGVVLSQVTEDDKEHPIVYLSRKFSDVEKKILAFHALLRKVSKRGGDMTVPSWPLCSWLAVPLKPRHGSELFRWD
ncbi:Retrovirus-related Pol polyprotein from transposon 17.6 [Araneus ventricosus]|uniref:RNA-directed DNA polymerase n=1 Tax=Araneus ventricosus TaxID=182803 RepID=A0A4Y2IAQ6_ARAVE|nr:Retrovirus-related Pol polyprotein from transposon 17.6 [Araneus ventricosus]